MRLLVSVTRGFSDERSMPIELVRNSGIVAFYEVSEIGRWIENEVGFSKIGGELANIDCIKTSKRSICLTGCTFQRWNVKRRRDRRMVRRR